MDNTTFLVLIAMELGLVCVYLRSIAQSMRKTVKSPRAPKYRKRSPSVVLSPPEMRQVLPRSDTVPARPSVLPPPLPKTSEIDIDLLTYANTMPFDEMDTTDIIGIPTPEEIASVITQDLEPDAIEHETEFYDLGAEIQKMLDAEDEERSLEEALDAALFEEKTPIGDKVLVSLGSW